MDEDEVVPDVETTETRKYFHIDLEDGKTFDILDAESALRTTLAWARARAAEYRTSDPTIGRASALVATHTEDALRVLLMPVP